MYVVIFKARINVLDEHYAQTAQHMRDKAFAEYGCVDFVALSEGDQEIALSYWNSLDDIRRWKQDLEHQLAQRHGREHWYADYSVEIAEVQRAYQRTHHQRTRHQPAHTSADQSPAPGPTEHG